MEANTAILRTIARNMAATTGMPVPVNMDVWLDKAEDVTRTYTDARSKAAVFDQVGLMAIYTPVDVLDGVRHAQDEELVDILWPLLSARAYVLAKRSGRYPGAIANLDYLHEQIWKNLRCPKGVPFDSGSLKEKRLAQANAALAVPYTAESDMVLAIEHWLKDMFPPDAESQVEPGRHKYVITASPRPFDAWMYAVGLSVLGADVPADILVLAGDARQTRMNIRALQKDRKVLNTLIDNTRAFAHRLRFHVRPAVQSNAPSGPV